MHTLNKQMELYKILHEAGYLTNFNDINEMTEAEVYQLIQETN